VARESIVGVFSTVLCARLRLIVHRLMGGRLVTIFDSSDSYPFIYRDIVHTSKGVFRTK
jgi:hypothetical protein